MRIGRRAWLTMAGASALLPLFASGGKTARAQGAPRMRLVLLMQSNGTSQSQFWPAPGGQLTSTILEPLVEDPRLQARTTVIKGLYQHAGGAGNAHDQGYSGMYSGTRSVGTFDDPWGGGISLDQILARELTFGVPIPTLNCGVLAADVPAFKDHRTSFSYLGPRMQVPTLVDPYRLYADLFSPNQDPALVKRRLAQRQSVLDYGAADLRALRGRLGAGERAKIDLHQSAIRDYEKRLAFFAAAAPAPGASPPALGLDPTNEDHVPALTPAMIDLVALALTNGLVQIVTFTMCPGGAKWRFRWLGIGQDTHDIAHHDDGKTPDVTATLVSMNRWYAGNVARLARALDAVPEPNGNGTVLDNTLIVWANEQATGQHSQDDIPVVLVGGAAGQLAGGRLIDRGPQTYHRLGCSLMGLMGAPREGFGEEPACGPVDGLLAAS
jgi:Protein of unknown function (DUF1552)